MIVHVHPDRSITLDDPDTFDAFSIRAPGFACHEIVEAFGSDAREDGDEHVFLSIARLHALGDVHGGAGWRKGCDAMIAYANGKGWVDERGEYVRAHIEPSH